MQIDVNCLFCPRSHPLDLPQGMTWASLEGCPCSRLRGPDGGPVLPVVVVMCVWDTSSQHGAQGWSRSLLRSSNESTQLSSSSVSLGKGTETNQNGPSDKAAVTNGT